MVDLSWWIDGALVLVVLYLIRRLVVAGRENQKLHDMVRRLEGVEAKRNGEEPRELGEGDAEGGS